MRRAIMFVAASALAFLPLQAFSAPAATNAAAPAATAKSTKQAGKKIDDLVAAFKAKLQAEDANKDGYVTREEAKAYKMARKKAKAQAAAERKAQKTKAAN